MLSCIFLPLGIRFFFLSIHSLFILCSIFVIFLYSFIVFAFLSIKFFMFSVWFNYSSLLSFHQQVFREYCWITIFIYLFPPFFPLVLSISVRPLPVTLWIPRLSACGPPYRGLPVGICLRVCMADVRADRRVIEGYSAGTQGLLTAHHCPSHRSSLCAWLEKTMHVNCLLL